MGLDMYLEGQKFQKFERLFPFVFFGSWRKEEKLDAYIMENLGRQVGHCDSLGENIVQLTASDIEHLIDIALDKPSVIFDTHHTPGLRWRRAVSIKYFQSAVDFLDDSAKGSRRVYYRSDR